MTTPSSLSAVNMATVAHRMQVNPPAALESSFWFSDREIGARQPGVVLEYTADDFRQELKRSERKLYWLAFASVLVALITAVVFVFFVLQGGINNV